jgi:hypothetical protein
MAQMFREACASGSDFDQPLAFDVGSVTSMSAMFAGATALSECNKRLIEDSLSASTAWAAAGYAWSSFVCTASPTASPTAPSASPSAAPSASPSVFRFTPASNAELKAALVAWDADATAAAVAYRAVGLWDVTAATGFNMLLDALANFDAELSAWDTSSVTNMDNMLRDAESFNSPVAFDTSSVTAMVQMFKDALSFNQPVPFDTSSVSSVQKMFWNAALFNQAVAFDTSRVTNMQLTFEGATVFNQPLAFDTSLVTNTEKMLRYAAAFNQPLDFDVGSVTYMYSMLYGTDALSDCNKRLTEDSLLASTAWAEWHDWSSYICTFTPTSTAELKGALAAWDADASAAAAEYGAMATCTPRIVLSSPWLRARH